MTAQPEDTLSAEAQAVRYELEAYARRWPEAKAIGIVWHLARVWIPARLRRKWRA